MGNQRAAGVGPESGIPPGKDSRRHITTAIALLWVSCAAFAVIVTLPDTSQTTTLNADVSEQADVTVPATIAFAVTDVSLATPSAAQSVSATSIVLNNGQALKISRQANSTSFTPPAGGTITWAASDVSWPAPAWTGGIGSLGTLSSAAYNTVATSTANPTELSTTALKFTLAGKSTVDRCGTHSLVTTWKFESVTP